MAEVYKHRRFTGIFPWEFDKEKIIARIVEEEGGKDIEVIGEELNSEEHSLSWEYGIMYEVIFEEEREMTGHELLGEVMEGKVEKGTRFIRVETPIFYTIEFDGISFKANGIYVCWTVYNLKAKWREVMK